jgi:drug/metabolite transporter (DMT)-like permease
MRAHDGTNESLTDTEEEQINMVTTGLIMTLLSSIGWSSADALRKRLTHGLELTSLNALLAAGQLIILVAVIPVYVLVTTIDVHSIFQLQSHAYWWYAIPSCLLTTAGHIYFLKSIQHSDLSLTIPYLSFTPIFVLITAIFVLQECPNHTALAGILIVSLGAFFLNRTGPIDQETRRGLGRLVSDRGSRYMVGTAIAWSAAATFDKAALQFASTSLHIGLMLFGTTLLLLMVALKSGHQQSMRTTLLRWKPISFVCLIMLCAMGLQFCAYAYWDVAHVEALKRAVGLVGSLVFGWLYFGESHFWRRVPLIAMMAVGSALVVTAT